MLSTMKLGMRVVMMMKRERERGTERKKFFCGLGLERSDLNRVGKH